MHALTTLTHLRFMRWLTSRHLLLMVAVIGLAALLASPELNIMRPAKAKAMFATRFVATTGSDGGGNTCVNSGTPCLTINYAIGQAVANDTINVAAGTYNEFVVVTKTLAFKGAQAGVDARTRAGAESIVAGNGDGAFQIEADNVEINGFTIQGATNDPSQPPFTGLGAGIWTNPGFSGTHGGHQILNNIIQNNIVGIELDNDGTFQTKVQFNLIQNNSAPGPNSGNGIAVDFGLINALIDNNKFTGNTDASLITEAASSQITLSNNESVNERLVVLFITTMSSITGNKVTGALNGAAIDIASGDDNIQITSNTILNNTNRGIRVADFFAGPNTNVTVNFNRIVGNPLGGLVIESDGYSGTLDATNNWWGCNYGPGNTGAGCAGTTNNVIVNPSMSQLMYGVNFTPWLTLGITAAPNSILVGGTSNLTADLTINSASANTSGSGNIPDGTPVAFAGVLGTVNPSNTSTTSGKANSTYTGTAPGSGSASSTVDGQTVSTPITVNAAPSPPIVKIGDPAVCLGPGSVVGVTVTVTNNNAAPQTVSVTATLPAQLQSLQNSCAANAGAFTNCNGGTTVAWSGTLAAGQTATLTYQAQVANGTLPNTQLCINTSATFGQGAPLVVQACTTVNCPVVGPGAPPPADAALSDQKAGSVLFYNIYTSNPANLTAQNTRINLTNTDPARSAVVHLFFVDGTTCTPADSFLCLTPNQTVSFTAGDIDPGTTGYIVAVASDPVTGCPINFNFLIGDEFVKFASGHAANLSAESFAALSNTLPPACIAGASTATLNFDGISYNPAPRVVAVDNFPSTADGNNTLLILNRVGGNLQSGASTIGSLFGVLYDEAEQPLSFTLSSNTCQLRGSLTNSFLRTTQRLETVISAGRSGWLRLWGVSDIGLLGSVINFNASAGVNSFSQGHNLHKLTFTTSASLTIPIIVPGC